jgi:hypothetical protein
MNNIETLRHRIRVHIANREHYSKVEFLDKLHEILHESEQTGAQPAPVQEPACWQGENGCPNRDACCNAQHCLYTTPLAAQPAVPEGWKLEAVDEWSIRVTKPDGGVWQITEEDGSFHLLCAMLVTPPAAPVPLTPAEVHGMAEAHGIDGEARHWHVVGIADSEKRHGITEKGQP